MVRLCTSLTLLAFAVTACGDNGGGDDSFDAMPGTPDAAAEPDAAPSLGITAVVPASAYYPGGRTVTITGTSFDGSTTVTVGGAACAGVAVASSTELSCVVPPGSIGTADVVVSDGSDSDTLTAGFTYDGFTRVDTVAGTGTEGSTSGSGDVAQLSGAINGLRLDGTTLYVADGTNYQIRAVDLTDLDLSAIDLADVSVSVVAGDGTFGTQDSTDSTGASAKFRQPDDLGARLGDTLYVSDTDWQNQSLGAVRKVDLTTGAVTTAATVNGASAIVADGTYAYVATCESEHDIKRLTLADDGVANWVGDPAGLGDAEGMGTAANFSCPYGLALSADGATLYVSEWSGHKIKKIDVATATATNFVGAGTVGSADNTDGTLATFSGPSKLTLAGDSLFVADQDNCTVREVDVTTGAVTTLVGSAGSCTATDGLLAGARLQYPVAILYAPDYGIFVAGADWGWRDPEFGAARLRLIH